MKKIVSMLLIILLCIPTVCAGEVDDKLREEYKKTLGEIQAKKVWDWALAGGSLGIMLLGLLVMNSGGDVLGPILGIVGGIGMIIWGYSIEPYGESEADERAERLKRIIGNPTYTDKEKEAIAHGLVYIGMTVRALEASLGRPDRINTSTGEWGTRKQYVYGDYGPYVYVEDGAVTSYQY